MNEHFLILHNTPKVLVVQSIAGIFDKFGSGGYGECNVGLNVGDEPKNVLQNRIKLLIVLRKFAEIKSIHWLNQLHGNTVIDIKQSLSVTAQVADAFITTCQGQALAIMTADCIPIAIFDDKNDESAVACIHAGWQGLTNGIIAKTVFKMRIANPKSSYQAVIGAHISQAIYEVTRELADKIINLVCVNGLVNMHKNELYNLVTKAVKKRINV